METEMMKHPTSGKKGYALYAGGEDGGVKELFIPVDGPALGKGKETLMHVLEWSGEGETKGEWKEGAEGERCFLLIHGRNREHLNVQHWTPILPFLRSLGQVVGVELLGHGNAVPGGEDELPSNWDLTPADHARLLRQMLEAVPQWRRRLWTLAGRSLGGAIAVAMAPLLSPPPRDLILIAPALFEADYAAVPAAAGGLKALFFWARADPWISSSLAGPAAEAFPRSTVHILECKGVTDATLLHCPELADSSAFCKAVTRWVAS